MTATDKLLDNAEQYASGFRPRSSPSVPRKGAVRGFVYEVESGRLREVV